MDYFQAIFSEQYTQKSFMVKVPVLYVTCLVFVTGVWTNLVKTLNPKEWNQDTLVDRYRPIDGLFFG